MLKQGSKLLLSLMLGVCPLVSASEPIDIMTENYAPYNFRGESGQLEGIAVDLLHEVMAEMDGKVQASPIKVLPWARAYRSVQKAGRLNMLFSMTRTPAREKLFKWVGPITETEIALLAPPRMKAVKLSEANLPLYKYAGVNGDIGMLELKAKGLKGRQLHETPRLQVAVKQVEYKRADFLAYDVTVANWFFKTEKYESKARFSKALVLEKASLYYAFNQSVPDATVAQFQQALDTVQARKGFMKALLHKYDGSRQ